MDRAGAMAAAATVAAVAAGYGDEHEERRRLAAPVVEALQASGLNGLVSPTSLGGSACDPMTQVEVIELIAQSDASTGWCAGIGMGSNFMSGMLDESESRELFTDVAIGGAGPFAPGGRADATPEGYSVSGRWTFASNCQQAAVVGAGIFAFADDRPEVLNADGSPEHRLAFFGSDQMEVHETWDTVGMRGTGSHDLVATAVSMPRERTATLFGSMWPDDPIFRLRSFDVLAPSLSPVPLGIGRAALDLVARQAVADADKPAFGPRPPLASDPVAQVELGRAEVRLRAAKALLLEALAASFEHALAGDTPPRANTAVIGLANCEALQAGKNAVDTAVRLLGSGAIRDASPLGRLRRDIDTAGAHIMFSPLAMAALTRELAGIPTTAFPYLPPPPD